MNKSKGELDRQYYEKLREKGTVGGKFTDSEFTPETSSIYDDMSVFPNEEA